ncbi:hypothetical protein FCG40_12240 [Fimbriimonadia bacterium ATM]|nr:MAG: hypothetical protein EDM73_10450 [Armatimonadota bacterium]MBC6970613.1 hypothetical protein [Armatimonadota bacterium]MCE7899478.1 hypothetical protein [Armatimonadetes bacterium ATM1]MDL1929745.1 hypothetical protein [Fimbriimonadia bacterium ATM]RIJ96503.1 MAG: hypothetical protein DCC45_07550 [Armatimonadota bacterium]
MTSVASERGVVAIIDVLGFKSAVKTDADGVLSTLESVAKAIEEEQNSYDNSPDASLESVAGHLKPKLKLHRASLGDTLVIGLEINTTSVEEYRPGASSLDSLYGLLHMGKILNTVLRTAIGTPAPLLYRGTFALGHFVVKENIYFGDAVFEAAELYGQSQAAIVWAAPSAMEILELVLDPTNELYDRASKIVNSDRSIRDPWVKHDIPLKSGGSYESLAVNPYYGAEGELMEIQRQVLRAFSGHAPDVLAKRHNTKKFLEVARKQAEEMARAKPG